MADQPLTANAQARTPSKLGYVLFVAMFLGPAMAMLVYMGAAVASSNVQSRVLAQQVGIPVAEGPAPEGGSAAAAGWETAALLVCPLH